MTKIIFKEDLLDANVGTILDGDKVVGKYKRAKSGPGFFVALDDIKFDNAPGARWSAEGGPAEWAYAKTLGPKAKDFLTKVLDGHRAAI